VLRRFGVVGVVAGAVFLLAGPAWAHVTISPTSAPKGSDAVLSFTVPDESSSASTTKIEVFFPTDHPIAEALVEPVTGWTAKVDTMTVTTPIHTDDGDVTEAVKSVTWTGGHVVPGDFQQFSVSVGLPDDAASLEFKAIQTYSDGTVVSWIEDTTPGQPEPDHPAPVLTLTAGDDETTATTGAGTTATTTASTGTATASGPVVKKSDVNSAKTLAFVGIGIGAVALIIGLGAFAMGRGPKRPSARPQ
jgi:periplasmic copper chaperone A